MAAASSSLTWRPQARATGGAESKPTPSRRCDAAWVELGALSLSVSLLWV